MTDEQQITIGEISRQLQRMDESTALNRTAHHTQINELNISLVNLSMKIDTYIGPVAVLRHQADQTEAMLPLLADRITVIERQTARIYGFAAAIGFLSGFVPAWFKR